MATAPSSAITFMSAIWFGIEAALKRDLRAFTNSGSGKPTTLKSLIATLKRIADRDIEVRYEPARSGEVHSTWCNIEKAQREFGYVAPTDLETGVRATWTWYIENQDTWSRQSVMFSSD